MPGSGLADFVARSEVRVEILEALSKGPKTPTELASLHSEHVSHVSRALAELRAQGLVEPTSVSSHRKPYKATQRGMELSLSLMHLAK